MSRDEALLSWTQYVLDNSANGTQRLEVQTVINMFDFIDEVAEELQEIIDAKTEQIDELMEMM